MILGQLYHYNKVLDDLKLPITAQDVDKVELMGVPKFNSKDFEEQDFNEIALKIRDVFSGVFAKILKQNNLRFSLSFWEDLTSPIFSQDLKIKASSDFQKSLLAWAKEGFRLNNLEEILKIGALTTDEDDFAIYYGLKVLFKFTQTTFSDEEKNIDLVGNDNTSLEFSTKPEILVITENLLSPLFVNLNCVYLPFINNSKLLLNQVKEILIKENQIKLVIVEGTKVEETAKYLQKNLPSGILTVSLDLTGKVQENQTFFDKIVKQTLGIRLT